MGHYITRTCPVCSKQYQADETRIKWGRETTCSRKCSYELRAQKQQISVQVTCLYCGKNVDRNPCENRKYCSLDCYHASRNPDNESLDRNCLICGKPFHGRHNKYCSRKCFEIAHKQTMTGQGNPAYIDGRSISKFYDAGAKWHDIRLEVYRRDNFTCQHCGVKCVSKRRATPETTRRIIQCHHIDPYKRSGNNAIDNLITLCLRCHRREHTRMKHERNSAATEV